MKFTSETSRGFSLVELIVSIGLFAIVAVAMAGAVVNVMDANRKSRSLVSIVDSLSFALDSMTRELRVGKNYDCGAHSGATDCSTPQSQINFDTSENVFFAYRLNTSENSIERCGHSSSDCPNPSSGANYQRMTGNDIEITDLRFYVYGTEPASDNEQPRVTIVVSGRTGTADTDSAFTIQTTVTQRLPDL